MFNLRTPLTRIVSYWLNKSQAEWIFVLRTLYRLLMEGRIMQNLRSSVFFDCLIRKMMILMSFETPVPIDNSTTSPHGLNTRRLKSSKIITSSGECSFIFNALLRFWLIFFKPIDTQYRKNLWGLNYLGRNSASQGIVNRIEYILNKHKEILRDDGRQIYGDSMEGDIWKSCMII
jgi:hypothetical protein